MKRRFFILLATVTVLLLMTALSASAAPSSGECGEDLRWTLDDNGVLAVSGSGEIDGPFTQAEALFERDGGHGMVFRALDGQLYLTLHSPNAHLQERPRFFPLEEKEGRLIRKEALK